MRVCFHMLLYVHNTNRMVHFMVYCIRLTNSAPGIYKDGPRLPIIRKGL